MWCYVCGVVKTVIFTWRIIDNWVDFNGLSSRVKVSVDWLWNGLNDRKKSDLVVNRNGQAHDVVSKMSWTLESWKCKIFYRRLKYCDQHKTLSFYLHWNNFVQQKRLSWIQGLSYKVTLLNWTIFYYANSCRTRHYAWSVYVILSVLSIRSLKHDFQRKF